MSAHQLAFVDIDTQFDFMDPNGRLYVPGSEEIVGNLERLFTFAARSKVPVLSSVDDHALDDPEFRDWPPHCVRGTPGQRKLPVTLMVRSLTFEPDAPLPGSPLSLLKQYHQLIFPKPTLSAFDNPHFEEITHALAGAEFVVFGVATDYCVQLAAQGLLERGQRVTIVRDAVRAVSTDTGAAAERKLSSLGAKWVTTMYVVGRVKIKIMGNILSTGLRWDAQS